MKNPSIFGLYAFLMFFGPSLFASELEYRPPVQQKPWQKLNLGVSWIPADGSGGLGMTRFNIDAVFPCATLRSSYSTSPSYFLLTPKFEYTSVDWKRETSFPDSLYDVGLGMTWMKPINERWSFMASATPRWASDGKESDKSLRCSAMFGFNWTPNNRWKVILGAAYLDRDDDMNFIPYAGCVWTPNDDWRVEMTLPQARVAKRIDIPLFNQMSENWGYAGLGFGGGNWAVRSQNGLADVATYKEYSFVLGTESISQYGNTFNLEVAYTFGREMEFDRRTQRDFKPDDSISLRAKFTF